MSDASFADSTRDVLRAQWHQFIDMTAEHRPQLFAYCRALTPTVWDAEDLLQDTLMKAFATLATVDDPIRNPRAYLMRISTNLWIDRVRRSGVVEYSNEENSLTTSGDDAERLASIHEVSGQLMRLLPPKQLAAILLKEIFDASLSETAEALHTTPGAVKSLLSRGREKIRRYRSLALPVARPPRALVEQFVALFNDADKEGLLELLLDTAVAGNVGTDTEWGYEGHRSRTSWLNGSLGGHPEWPAAFQFEAQRAELAVMEQECVVLLFRNRKGREALESVIRLEGADDAIASLKSYAFSPELLREVADHFGLAVRTGAYRYPTPGPGQRFMDETA